LKVIGTKKIPETLCFLLTKSYQLERHPLTLYNLALLYCRGDKDTPQDLAKSELFYKKLQKESYDSDSDSVSFGFLELSVMYDRKQQPKKSLELLEIAAVMGRKEAINNIAHIYQHGREATNKEDVIETNVNKALELYKKGHDLGEIHCSYQLGCIYQNGLGGVKKNLHQALRYFQTVVNSKSKKIDDAEELAQIRISAIEKKIKNKEKQQKLKEEKKFQTEQKQKEQDESIEKKQKQKKTERKLSRLNNVSSSNESLSEKESIVFKEKEELRELLERANKKIEKEERKKELRGLKNNNFLQNNILNEPILDQEDEDSSEEEIKPNLYETKLKNNNHKTIVFNLFNDCLTGYSGANKTKREEIESIFKLLDPNYTNTEKGSHKSIKFDNEEVKKEGILTLPNQGKKSPYLKEIYLKLTIEKLILFNCYPPELEELLIKKNYLVKKKEKK
jgi:TPR repeat protein